MNEKETYNTDGIECPWCGYIEDDSEVKYDIAEGDLEKFDCPDCGESINVTHNILHSWEASQRTREWLEEEITRIKGDISRAVERNSKCSSLFDKDRGEIEELKEEIKNL